MDQEKQKSTFWRSVKQTSGKQKLITIGLMALLSIGAMGALGEFSGNKNSFVSNLAETVGLKKKTSSEAAPLPTNTPQLSKEYIYAGSRMLATEDYGIAQPNPTP